jgi:hypothetical protein
LSVPFINIVRGPSDDGAGGWVLLWLWALWRVSTRVGFLANSNVYIPKKHCTGLTMACEVALGRRFEPGLEHYPRSCNSVVRVGVL